MPAKKKSATNDRTALYEALIASIPAIERKGDANPYTSLNGNMFTLLQASRSLAIRLPQDKREEFMQKYKTKIFEAYGTQMPEYVAVPGALLSLGDPHLSQGDGEISGTALEASLNAVLQIRTRRDMPLDVPTLVQQARAQEQQREAVAANA